MANKVIKLLRERILLWENVGKCKAPEWSTIDNYKGEKIRAANSCILSITKNKEIILFLDVLEEGINTDKALDYYLKEFLDFLRDNAPQLEGPKAMLFYYEVMKSQPNWIKIKELAGKLDVSDGDEFNFGISTDSMDYMDGCIKNLGFIADIKLAPYPSDPIFKYIGCHEDMPKQACDGDRRYGLMHLIIAEQIVGMDMCWDDLEEMVSMHKENKLFATWCYDRSSKNKAK